MKYKIIATDMDKTLLNENHKIGEKSIKAIVKAQKEGVVFILASGRPTTAMKKYAKELEMTENNGYIISYNGAKITRCKDWMVLFQKGLLIKDLEYLFNFAKENDTSIVTYIDGIIYAYNRNKYTEIEKDYTGFSIVDINSPKDLKVSEVMKCIIIDEEEKIKKLHYKFNTENKEKYFSTISDPHFLEITNIKVNKGKTLKFLCDLIGVKMENVIACGDSYNDISMLKEAGLAIAPENANKDIKKICDDVLTDHKNDFMKDVINKYIF